jgi:hypothetical protein
MDDYYTFPVNTNSARITRETLLVKIAEGLEMFFQEIRVSSFNSFFIERVSNLFD